MVVAQRKTHADLAARAPALAKLHLTLLAIRDGHSYASMRAIDDYFTRAATRALTIMGHLTLLHGDETDLAFSAADLLPPREDLELGNLLVGIELAIAEESWNAINSSGTTSRGGAAGRKAADDPAPDPAWDAARPDVATIAAGARSRAVGITDTTRAALAQTISAGAAAGYTVRQISNGVPADGYAGVRAIVAQTYKNRGMAIAQYELGTAQNVSSVAQYRAAQLESAEIMDDEGPNSCDECEALDGMIVDLDWAAANPLSHPWCVRVFVPHFPEDEPDDSGDESPSGAQAGSEGASDTTVGEVPAQVAQGPLSPDSNLSDTTAASIPAGAQPIPRDHDFTAGEQFVATYRGSDYVLTVVDTDAGTTGFMTEDGTVYSSLSAAASGITGSSQNGWTFWGALPEPPAPPPLPPITSVGSTPIDRGVPLEHGDRLIANYDGVDHILEVVVKPDGSTVYIVDGVKENEYTSLSAAGNSVTGNSVNGWRFWRVPAEAEAPPVPGAPPKVPPPLPPAQPPPVPGAPPGATPGSEQLRQTVLAAGPQPTADTWNLLSPEARTAWLRQWPDWAVNNAPASIDPVFGPARMLGPIGYPEGWNRLNDAQQAAWRELYPNAEHGMPDVVWDAQQSARVLGHSPTLDAWNAASPDAQGEWSRMYPSMPPDQSAWIDKDGHGRFEAPDSTTMPSTWSWMTRTEQTAWLADHTPADFGEPPTPTPRPKQQEMIAGKGAPIDPLVKATVENTIGDMRARFPEPYARISLLASVKSTEPKLANAFAWNTWVGYPGPHDSISVAARFAADFKEMDHQAFVSDHTKRGGLFFHPTGTGTPEGIIVHEFGHSVQRWLDDLSKSDAGVKRIWDDYQSTMAQVTDISDYGRTNFAEQFAESFSAVYMHSQGAVAPKQLSVNEIDTATFLNELFSYLRGRPVNLVDEGGFVP